MGSMARVNVAAVPIPGVDADAGRVVEEGTTAEVFAAPRMPYTAGLLGSVDQLEPIERYLLVDDTWADLLAGRVELERVLQVSEALSGDDHPAVWRRLGQVLSGLRRLVDPADLDDYRGWVRQLSTPALAFAGSTRCPVVINVPTSPNARCNAKPGTGSHEGRWSTLPTVAQNVFIVTASGATAFTGPETVGVAMAH